MKIFNRILFATDFSRYANNALHFAVQLAQIFESELHVVHVISGNEPGFDEKMRKQYKTNTNNNLDSLIDHIDLEKDRIFVLPVTGHSVEEGILDYIKNHKIDLVVLGTHGSGWGGSFFLGNVAERISRHAPCSVLTVSKRSNKEISNILIPIDFSESSKVALSFAKEIAAGFDAHLSLLHVIEIGEYPSFYNIHDYDLKKMISKTKSKSPNVLKKMFNNTPGPKVEADNFVVVGQAAFQIIKFINNYEPDLVIISSHGLTNIDYFLMGSVAEKIIKRANCPVLSLKSKGIG